MKILLLGGNGYIGSKFFQHNKKYDITSVDVCLFGKDLGYSLKTNFANVDITDFDVIICLAGHSSVQMCQTSFDRSWINNVDYFRNLCEKLTPTQRLIYASSASIYGTGASVSHERSPINFNTINNYDLEKITIDLIASKFINSGKNIIGLRFGTVNGSSPNTRADLMLNSMVKSAIETNTIKVKNLKIRRAILSINDLILALDKLIEKNITPGQYNLASFNSTVETMATIVSKITGAQIVTYPDDPIQYDFELNTDKIKQELDFEFTGTVEGIVTELNDNINTINFDIRDTDRNFINYLK